MYLRYVPTDLNVADGPSRGARIGEHPSDPNKPHWKKKKAADSDPAPQQYRGQG